MRFLRIFAALAVLGAASVACPKLPPTANCTPLAHSCRGDRPSVCSSAQRWEPAGDVACSAVGAVCQEEEGRAFCARVTDAGVDGE